MATQNVLFFKATKEKFDALDKKKSNAIYFVEDIPAIYVGDILFAVGSTTTSLFPGLMSPEYKAKIDEIVSGGMDNDEIITALDQVRTSLENKADSSEVYTKTEVDEMIESIINNMVTSDTLEEVQSTIGEIETKVDEKVVASAEEITKAVEDARIDDGEI